MKSSPFNLSSLMLFTACAGSAGYVPESTPDGLAPATAPVTTPGDNLRANDSEIVTGPLLIGQSNTVAAIGTKPGSELILLASQTGMGDGPCDTFFAGVCSQLLDPWILAETDADGNGDGAFEVVVDPDEPARPVYLELLMRDPISGVSSKARNAVERHFTVPAALAAVSFSEVTDAVGLTETYTHSNTHTGGAAFVDYNGDFWPDLFITNGGGEPHYLYRNQGDGTFVNVSHLVEKPDPDIEDAGVKFADFDNDGDSDILVVVDHDGVMKASAVNVPEGGPNLYYENQGDGTFVERAGPVGLLDPSGRRNSCGALGDYDLDGYVDAYFGVWAMNSGPYVHDNWLARNNGDGTFTEVVDSPSHGDGLDTLVVQFMDPDLDGRPDLYVANVAAGGLDNLHGDQIYMNDGVDFTDRTDNSPGLGDDARAAMGIDLGDIDNDGDFEMYITDGWGKEPYPTGGVLYDGRPDGTFSDNICDVVGVCIGYHTWPVHFADFDRDGWIDLRVGTTYEDKPDMMYVNKGDGTFGAHEVPAFNGNLSQGSAMADYDGDGDMDLLAQNRFMDSLLFRNDGIDDNNWLELKLIGTTSNRDAIGAHVTVATDDLSQIRRVSGTDSAHSQSELIVHVGLGDAESADVEIRWPGGEVQTVTGVPANQLSFVDETLGLLEESMVDARLDYDKSAKTLTIHATSAFGGRTALSLDTFGDLTWDPEALEFSAAFTGVGSDPGIVTLRSTRGGTWELGDPAGTRGGGKGGGGCGCETSGGVPWTAWLAFFAVFLRRRNRARRSPSGR